LAHHIIITISYSGLPHAIAINSIHEKTLRYKSLSFDARFIEKARRNIELAPKIVEHNEPKILHRFGAIQKICHAFWTKFDPFPPLCHKLSHMAKPPIKKMSQAIIPPPHLYAFYTNFSAVIIEPAKG